MFLSSRQRRRMAGLEMTGKASAVLHFARDGSQRHANRDGKRRNRDSKNSCFGPNMTSPRPSATGGVGQQCWDV